MTSRPTTGATLGSSRKIAAGGLAILVSGVAIANAQTCPHDLICYEVPGGGCAPPWVPLSQFPADYCGCGDNNFFNMVCTGGYGADYEKCCTHCEASPDFNTPCLSDVEPPCTTCGSDVEPPCTTCGSGGAGGSSPPPSAPPSPTAAGHPVSLTTGAVFFSQTDAVVGEIQVRRTYNSDRLTVNRHGAFGPGWNGSFESRLRVLSPRAFEVRDADGARYYHDADGDGTYEAVLPLSKESWLVVVPEGGYRVIWRAGGLESYDANGRVLSVADASGVETTYAYDDGGRCVSVSRLGRSVSVSYSDDSPRPSQLVGPGGVVLATYIYDPTGTLDSVRYPDGGGFRFGYDGAGRVVWVKDLDGNPVEKHEYAWGRAATSEVADGRKKLTLTYGTNVTTVTDALGTVSTYEYQNVAGTKRVTKATGPCALCGTGGVGSGERRWTYDDAGNLVQYRNEVGDVWTYTYSADNDLLTDTNPLGQTTTYTHYPDGRVHTVTGPDGSLTTYTYGPAGPLSITQRVTSTENRTTGMTYTPQGKVEDLTDPRGKITHLTYTLQGDLDSVTDPLGHAAEFGYDDFGRRTTVTDALGHTTTTQYDARSRVTRIVQHDGTHTDFAYDRRSNRTSVTDPQGHVTQYIYDQYGLLERVVDPAEGVTQYSYDLMGQLTGLTDAMGRTTRFEYQSGRLVRTVYPGAGEPSETYVYDQAGRIVTKVDRKGVTTTFSYDALGRLYRKDYSDSTPAVTYTYDEDGAIGRLTSAANGSDTLRWTYDFAGQLRSEQSTRNATVVSYSYDAAGNRLSLSLDGQLHVSYGYDDASRLTSITKGTAVFEFTYDDANRRATMTYPNGVVTTYAYDVLNRPTNLQAVLNGTTVLTSFGYTYDPAGNRVTKSLPEYTETYGYDPLYRLTQVQRTGSSPLLWTFSYDGVGSRVTAQQDSVVTTSSYNEKNELMASTGGGRMLWRGALDESGHVTFTSALVNGQPARMLSGNVFEALLEMQPGTNTVTVEATDTTGNTATKSYEVDVSGGGAAYTYDSNGNLTSKTEGSDSWAYTWNAENQLTKVEKNGAEQARFAYDPLGRRVEKVAGGVTAGYAYDQESILREVRGGTTLTYVQGRRVDEPLLAEGGSAPAYMHQDALGSLVRSTNPAGAVTLAREYDAWGKLQAGGDQAGYAFTGREWDPETGLYYYRARYYEPSAARFLSPDPLPELTRPLGRILTVSYAQPYVYTDNNPVNRVDPVGLLGVSRNRDCSNQGPTCEEYGECENYMGANARCFCRCAGNDPWSSYVRCCLRDLYPKYTPDEAHLLCYIMASAKYRYLPGPDLNRCFFQCSMDQAHRCNTCFMRM